jgi:chlorophyll synthase
MSRPAASAVVQLLKPITWFAPMWAFGCGLISVTAQGRSPWLAVCAGILLAGPLVCATSQAVNDWFDRHVDAINEPTRPIPSGRIPGRWGLYIAVLWTALSLLVAATLGVWGFGAALVGLLLAWAYSAPPIRLKRNGWWGNAAVAVCYEGVPWVTGAAIMAAGAMPAWRVLAIAALYSFGAHGIMTLNDFKSVEGDRQLGIGSLPVRLGVTNAGRVACFVMAFAQCVVVAMLLTWGKVVYATCVAVLLTVQVILMVRLLRSPRERAPWYNATGTSLYVMGMLLGAFALRSDMLAPT